MKKAILILFCLSLLTACPLSAATKSNVTLSDAIYADLALSHYLDNVSIFYSDGKKVNDIKLNETRHWLPASTVKTFTAMYAYKLMQFGVIHSKDTVTIDAKNEVPTELVTDALPTLLTGDVVDIDRLIRQMLIQSDNTAFNQLLDILGRDHVTAYIQSLGLTHSRVGSKLNLDESQTQYEYDVSGYGINTTTAEDYAKAFQFIKNNKIPGAPVLYAILKDQKINNMIPLYLPKSVVCAHKTGDLDPLYHDGGICTDKYRSYVLAIFTNAGDPSLVGHLSQIIYTKNFNLVGQNPDKAPIGQNLVHPIDPLVMTTPSTYVLGASATNFPVPDITAADLGIKASDLSLNLKNSDLPQVFIPADSPFHGLSDAWQITKEIFALGAAARRDVNLQTGKLRIAEAKDLIRKGKTQEAEKIFLSVQTGLNRVAKDTTLESDPIAQNTLEAISETRFSALGETLKNTQGDERLTVIKQIAEQAKQTIQQVQPNIPEATNATNPSQKPLVGEIIKSTPTEVTVKTAGGQEITIPTNSSSITLKDSGSISVPTPTTITPTLTSSPSLTPEVSSTPSIRSIGSLAVGTTVAMVGSNVNNVFAPTLIIPNVPREFVAPQPVIVAKVTTDHIVVEENGVYTQVNVNKNTTVKAADTSIPLSQIKAGDIVVVHGEPLTPVVENTVLTPTHLVPPVISPSLGVTSTPSTNPNSQSLPTSIPVSNSTVTPTNFVNAPIVSPGSPSIAVSKQRSTPVQQQTTKQTPTGTTQQNATKPSNIPAAQQSAAKQIPAPATQQNAAKSTTGPATPQVIQSTSIQVIEKKKDVSSPPPSQPANTPSTPQTPPKQQVPQQPAQQQPAAQTNPQPTKTEEKKK